MISTPGPSRPSRPAGASRSWMTTSAASSRSSPRTVIRSSAPGPPPTSTTRPVGAPAASATGDHLAERGAEAGGGLGGPPGDADPARPQAGEGLAAPDREPAGVQAGPDVGDAGVQQRERRRGARDDPHAVDARKPGQEIGTLLGEPARPGLDLAGGGVGG